jgi:hemerythrin
LAPPEKKRGFYQYFRYAAIVIACAGRPSVHRITARECPVRRPVAIPSTALILIKTVAKPAFQVQAYSMRKTSDIIWQDAQHQVLFEILDLLKQPAADREVLCRLEEYTRNHFELEEQYMRELGFPGLEAHERAHQRFRQEISKLLEEGQELDAVFREIISTFLTEWLTRHVFGIDKELERFILQAPAK